MSKSKSGRLFHVQWTVDYGVVQKKKIKRYVIYEMKQ